jgi:hypothetical protein
MKKKVFWIALGGIAGFAYYYFVGCYNGACLIQSNPYLSTLYGLAMGWAVSTVTVPDAKNEKNTDSPNG